MKTLIFVGIGTAILAVTPALAQGPAYPTPDNNLTRTDDVDPADAPNMNLEYGQPDPDVAVAPYDAGPLIEPPPPPPVEVAPE